MRKCRRSSWRRTRWRSNILLEGVAITQDDTYTKSLNELVEFFKNERDREFQYYTYAKEESKFNTNSLLGVAVFVTSVSAILISIDSKIPGLVLLLLSLSSVFIYLRSKNEKDMRLEKKHNYSSYTYDMIIGFLQHIKILKIKVNLVPLTKNIRARYEFDYDTYQEYHTLWLDKIRTSLEILNKEIDKKERSTK